MRNDAAIKFRQILCKHNINAEFNKAVKDLGIKPNKYLTLVEAIYAFRRIFNFYDDSVYAKVAVEWEDTVVLNRYSKTINNHSDAHSMATVIRVIHALQAEDKWPVPQGLDKLVERKAIINTAINSKTDPDKTNPTTPPKPQPNTIEPSTSSLHLTSPKPSLPDTKPLSSIPSFDSDDGAYDILDLSATRAASRVMCDDYHILVHYEKGRTYRVRMNNYISNLVREHNAMYVHVRTDKLIGKVFLVFSPTQLPGSILCRWNDKEKRIIVVSSKILCEYLINKRTLTGNKLQRHVSQNLAKKTHYLTFELLPD